VAQNDVSAQVADLAASYASKSWQQLIKGVVDITSFYLEKFREIAAASPESEREVTESMVTHEIAFQRFGQLELAGDSANSLNDVIAQLKYPLTPPR
jgi:hypothetical protein